MNCPGIYAIRNTFTGDQYIGRAVNIQNRLWKHKGALRSGKSRHPKLLAAWNKYGEAAFEFLLVEECPLDMDTLILREQHYLDERKPKYNIGVDAALGGYKGLTHTEATKKKLSAARKGKNHLSAEAREKVNAFNRQRVRTPEEIERARQARWGKPWTPSDETRARMSKSAKKRATSEEMRRLGARGLQTRWGIPGVQGEKQ